MQDHPPAARRGGLGHAGWTRIPVTVILEHMAEGESWDTLLAGSPELKKEDIQAALLYA